MQASTKFHWQAVDDSDIVFYNFAGCTITSLVLHQNLLSQFVLYMILYTYIHCTINYRYCIQCTHGSPVFPKPSNSLIYQIFKNTMCQINESGPVLHITCNLPNYFNYYQISACNVNILAQSEQNNGTDSYHKSSNSPTFLLLQFI